MPLPLVCWVRAGPQVKGSCRGPEGMLGRLAFGNGPADTPLIPRYEMCSAQRLGVDVGGEDGHSVPSLSCPCEPLQPTGGERGSQGECPAIETPHPMSHGMEEGLMEWEAECSQPSLPSHPPICWASWTCGPLRHPTRALVRGSAAAPVDRAAKHEPSEASSQSALGA